MKKRMALLLVMVFLLGLVVGFGEGQAPDDDFFGLRELTRDDFEMEVSEDADHLLAEDWSGYGVPWPEGGYINDGGKMPVKAMISFMDDDCRAQTYELLYREVIEPLELPYTLSLPIGKLDSSYYITQWELEEMMDSGVSIACHTLGEFPMTDYDPETMNAMLTEWKLQAEALGIEDVLSYAYCNGIWTDDVMTTVKAHFRMGFTVDEGINQMPYESYYMKRVGLFARVAEKVIYEVRDGAYLNANCKQVAGTPGQRMITNAIRVSEGEEYVLTCSAIWNGACYAVYNSAGQVLDKYNAKDTQKGELLTDYRVVIPEGASYMIVSHNAAAYPDQQLSVKKLPHSSTLAGAKEYVDRVAKEGGWLVFMTHAWYPWFNTEDLITLVEYIRAKNIPIVDVNDAIRTTGNVIEVGNFKKPMEYASEPFFVVSADGRVYTNSLSVPEIPDNYKNVKVKLRDGWVLESCKTVKVKDKGFVASEVIDVTGYDAMLVTGWAYRETSEDINGFQIYVIKDASGNVLDYYTATRIYAEGGDRLDHAYVELPEGAAMVIIAGNIYETRPELTLIRSTGG